MSKGKKAEKQTFSIYLNGEAVLHIFTRFMAVHICPESSTSDALRRKGHVVINVLSPVHKQLRVVIFSPFTGAPYYFPADPPRLWTRFVLLLLLWRTWLQGTHFHIKHWEMDHSFFYFNYCFKWINQAGQKRLALISVVTINLSS